MDRKDIILEFARKDHRGIEVGPYWNPLAPKAAGWNVLNLDVFDAPELRRRAARDPNIPPEAVANIEEVDLVGPAHRIGELVAARGEIGLLDFIISSHNFEHLPDPISFVQACATVLRPGGVLSMAIPDKRCCFDYFRPLSTLCGVLQAWADKRARPTAAQVFEHLSMHCCLRKDGEDLIAFPLTGDTHNIIACRTVEEAHEHWRSRLGEGGDAPTYMDAHCWTFVPSSFRLLLLDLQFLGYMPFELLRFHETIVGEFYVHLRNMRGLLQTPLSRNDYYEERQRLLQAVSQECSLNAVPFGHRAAARVGLPAAPSLDAVSPDGEVGDLECEIDAMREELEITKAEKRGLKAELEAAQGQIVALLNSRSWRVTAPLRRVAHTLRRRR